MVPASWTSPSVASSSRHPGEKQAPWCFSPSCLFPSCPTVEPPFPRSQPAGAPLGLCPLCAAGEVVGEWGLEPALACTNTQSMSVNLDPSLALGAVPAPEAAEGPLQLFPLYPAHGELGECLACLWLGWGWDRLGTVSDREAPVPGQVCPQLPHLHWEAALGQPASAESHCPG